MSTRGFISFAVDGETKTAYWHHASPDGAGVDVLQWARTAGPGAKAQAQSLRVVTEADEPTDEDVARLAPYTNRHVGGRSERPTWYQLLRETQGHPQATLQAGVIEDSSSFPADSLFAEYGYVIDFDAQVLEVYVGFQKEPHAKGRFAAMDPVEEGYYPVALAASWPLSDLPDDEAFYRAVDAAEPTS